MKRHQIDKSLLWLYAISVILFLRYYILYSGYNVWYDTWSYLKAYDTILREGIDAFRTPAYPLFLGGMRYLCGDAYTMVVPLVQYAVMLAALYYFYKLVKSLISNKTIVFILTLSYIVYPYGVKWCVLLLTESLAISGSTIFLYLLYRIYSDENPSKRLYFLLGFTLFLLFMLRPQFLFMLPPLAVFAIALYIRRRKEVWRYALSVLIPCVALLTYCCGVYAKYGIFAPSSVSTLNQYVMLNLMEDGHYNVDDRYRLPVEGDYHESVQDTTLCSENDWKWGQITSKYSYPVVKEAVSNTLRLNFSEYLRYRVDTHWEFWKWDRYTGLLTEFGGLKIDTLSLIALKIFMMAVMAYFLYIAVSIWRHHEVPWFGLTVAVFALSNYAVTVIGAQSEWPRLCAPSLTAFMICIGQLLEAVRFHFTNRKRFPKD